MRPTTDAAPNAVRNVCHDSHLSETVVFTVADAMNVDPLDLEPLNSVVDPDALDTLFQSSDRSASVELSFSLGGCDVVVRSEGEVVVTPPTAGEHQATPAVPGED